MASLRFDFDKCALEVKAFERQIAPLLQKDGAQTQTTEGQQAKFEVAKRKQRKVEDLAKTEIPRGKIEARAEDTFGDPEAYMRIGISHMQGGKPEKAKECFESALNFRPNNATVWFHLGRANSDLGNQSEAVKCYQKVLEINPEHLAAFCELGYSYGQMGNHKQAGKCYKKLVDINPNDVNAWIGLGLPGGSPIQFGLLTLVFPAAT